MRKGVTLSEQVAGKTSREFSCEFAHQHSYARAHPVDCTRAHYHPMRWRDLSTTASPPCRAGGQYHRQSMRGRRLEHPGPPAAAARTHALGAVLRRSHDRNQLMRLASAYQVEHVVLFSDMVSIAEAVDIFRSATPIIASFEPVSGPSLACVRIDGAAASTEVVDRLVADGRRSFAYISGRASSWVTRSAGAGFPTP